jgi:hypothetical protein
LLTQAIISGFGFVVGAGAGVPVAFRAMAASERLLDLVDTGITKLGEKIGTLKPARLGHSNNSSPSLSAAVNTVADSIKSRLGGRKAAGGPGAVT